MAVHKSGDKIYPNGIHTDESLRIDKEYAAMPAAQVAALKSSRDALAGNPLMSDLVGHLDGEIEFQAQAGHGYAFFTIPFKDQPDLTAEQKKILSDLGDTYDITERTEVEVDHLAARFLEVAGLPANPEAVATYNEFRKALPEGTQKQWLDFVESKHAVAASGSMTSGSAAGGK